MIVMDFIERMKPLGIFSTAEINLLYPDLDKRRLFEWRKKGYLEKVRNGWYCLPGFLAEPYGTWIIANLVHSPSYISLESALSYHGLIPEGVFMTTSVTTNRPVRMILAGHPYSYSRIKTGLFSGYQLLETETSKRKIRIADLEKAIVDFFYLHPEYNIESSIADLRFNEEIMSGYLNRERLWRYLDSAANKELENRVVKLLNIYPNA